MKLIFRYMLVFLTIGALFTACGYHNPYVYSGPDRSIYVTTWKNRTNVLLLDAKIYQSLIKWYQKSGSLSITKKKEGANFILAGEIISIDLPSLTFRADNNTSEVKIRLKVRYILKDLATDKILVERPAEVRTQAYKTTSSATATRDNEKEALEIIIDELSQKIYQESLLEFANI